MIYIDNRQTIIDVTDELINHINLVLDFAAKEEKVNIPFEISVTLVDNEEIKKINARYRNIDRETDVLSFPMLEYEGGKVFEEQYEGYHFREIDLDEGNLVLGDIILSLEKAESQSEEYGHSFLREVFYLTVHSLLHLLGYDHMEEDEKARMRSREEDILSKLDCSR